MVFRLPSAPTKAQGGGGGEGQSLGTPTCPTDNTRTGRVCVNKDFFFFYK